ncbi:MAG: glycosyltransferase [Betaproteobacteria bacterium]|nr:glycosyltransferase [Betaproteobacteria bacterium]
MKLCGLYDPSSPGYRDLFEALAEKAEVRAVAPACWGAIMDRRPAIRVRPLFLPVWPGRRPWRQALHVPLLKRLAAGCDAALFTRPDQRPLLPAFAGKVRGYLACDDFTQYGRDWDADELDLIRSVDCVIAVSKRLADRLARRADLPRERIAVLPNAIPARHVPPVPPARPRASGQPLAGVLGRVSSRLRLDWLVECIEATPWLHWVLAGDVEEGELLEADRPRIEWLRRHPRCTLTGRLSYDALAALAATLDVGVMPYSERSVNPHGSPMRLFLHLPCGAPILSTPGCPQSDEFAPLVRRCDSADELVAALESLRQAGFDDGLRPARWLAAQDHTWERRADVLLTLLRERAP